MFAVMQEKELRNSNSSNAREKNHIHNANERVNKQIFPNKIPKCY